MASKGSVKFHDINDSYGSFSPLSPHAIVVRHVAYPSVQHFFLCEKYKGTDSEAEIRAALTPWEVERCVRKAESSCPQRDNWDTTKMDVMLLGNYYKFKQNADAQALLLQTGSKSLVDHTPTDSFWGDGGDGTGKNLLGLMLMAVRKRLVLEEKTKKPQPPPKRST